MTSEKHSGTKRPFHFMVTFWGERYRNYFVDLFLPSMLAPNNLPLLHAEDGHRHFIAAPSQDWAAIKSLPIMERLRRHAEPIWIEVKGPPEVATTDAHARYAAVIRHMQVCQRTALEAGYDSSCYGSLHFPDTIISDGMVRSLLNTIAAGQQLVLCPALRQAEEGVVAELHALGLLSPGLRPSSTGQELNLPARLAADIALRHLHPEMAAFEEGAPGQPPLPPFRYWRMPGGRGILLHTFFIIPVLMDYRVVAADHTSCLDRDAVENVYVSANFSNCERIHVVQDSDEFMMMSLTPEATDRSAPELGKQGHRSTLRRRYDGLCDLRASFQSYARKSDVVKCDLFRKPVRWHAKELDEVWMDQERRIEKLFKRAIGDYPTGTGRGFNWRTFLLDHPIFEWPSIIRGFAYRLACTARDLGRNLVAWMERRA